MPQTLPTLDASEAIAEAFGVKPSVMLDTHWQACLQAYDGQMAVADCRVASAAKTICAGFIHSVLPNFRPIH